MHFKYFLMTTFVVIYPRNCYNTDTNQRPTETNINKNHNCTYVTNAAFFLFILCVCVFACEFSHIVRIAVANVAMTIKTLIKIYI